MPTRESYMNILKANAVSHSTLVSENGVRRGCDSIVTPDGVLLVPKSPVDRWYDRTF